MLKCSFSVSKVLTNIISLNFIEKKALFFNIEIITPKLCYPTTTTTYARDDVYTLMLIKLLGYECEVINMLALIACRESSGLLS